MRAVVVASDSNDTHLYARNTICSCVLANYIRWTKVHSFSIPSWRREKKIVAMSD